MHRLECMTIVSDPERSRNEDRLIQELQRWVMALSGLLTLITALLVAVCL